MRRADDFSSPRADHRDQVEQMGDTGTDERPLEESVTGAQSGFASLLQTARGTVAALWEWLGLLVTLVTLPARLHMRRARPWSVRIGRRTRQPVLSEQNANDLLQRHRDLQDMQKIADLAAGFRSPESEFFGDPREVERLMRWLLEQNPPWLYVSRVLASAEQGSRGGRTDYLYREQNSRALQDVTLYVPDENWRDLPLSSLTMRPTRTLNEVWQARLLDQILPPEILVDRHARGEILVPVRNPNRQRLEFQAIERRMELETRAPVPIPIPVENGEGEGGQLLYFLLDYSGSMQGKSAVLAMAVIAAALRAHLGRPQTRYLFRRFAEELWPRQVEPPLQAGTVQEKDTLLDTILATGFNGSATHVNHALRVAVADIWNLRREEHLDASLLLVTDGKAEILESTRRCIQEARVKVHSVVVTPQKNESLEAMSESYTALNVCPELLPGRLSPASAGTQPGGARPRHYRI